MSEKGRGDEGRYEVEGWMQGSRDDDDDNDGDFSVEFDMTSRKMMLKVRRTRDLP